MCLDIKICKVSLSRKLSYLKKAGKSTSTNEEWGCICCTLFWWHARPTRSLTKRAKMLREGPPYRRSRACDGSVTEWRFEASLPAVLYLLECLSVAQPLALNLSRAILSLWCKLSVPLSHQPYSFKGSRPVNADCKYLGWYASFYLFRMDCEWDRIKFLLKQFPGRLLAQRRGIRKQ